MEADPLPSNAVDIDAGNSWKCSENNNGKNMTVYSTKRFQFLHFENVQFHIQKFHKTSW